MDVALLTDSASCLPPGSAPALSVLPLHVVVAGRRGDSREVGHAELVEVLRSSSHGVRVSTSRVSPGEFAEGYRELVARTGCRDIVSVHLSGGVSGTVEAARLAAIEAERAAADAAFEAEVLSAQDSLAEDELPADNSPDDGEPADASR